MSSFNISFLLLILLGGIFLLGLLIFLLVLFIRKVKRGWLWLILLLIFIVGGLFIRHQIINKVFYAFKVEVCNTYPEIENIELRYVVQGRICALYIDLKEDIGDEQAEKIFIDLMKRVNKEPMSSYLKGNSTDEYAGWNVLQVDFHELEKGRFTSEWYNHSEWFTEENKQEQAWRNSETDKDYLYSDHVE